ncbi:MAG: SRPBCC family protein [Acidimicrobiales bacterium]
MQLTNEFRVGVPVDEAWAVLTAVERIAPCLPGAQLQEVDGDEYRGVVKVKVGPITAQYKGTATFIEQDAVAHRAVLRAEGRDTRGQGNASATVTATLQPDGEGTAVSVVTDLTITGKVAQFGRGVLADVSGKLIGQFVENLERDVLSTSTPAPAPPVAPSAVTNGSSGPRRIDAPEAQPVDLLATAGSPVAKRVAPLAVVLGVIAVFLWRRARRH